MNGSGPAPSAELRAQFGEIDIYLFDQVLRGRFDGRPPGLLSTRCTCEGSRVTLILALIRKPVERIWD